MNKISIEQINNLYAKGEYLFSNSTPVDVKQEYYLLLSFRNNTHAIIQIGRLYKIVYFDVSKEKFLEVYGKVINVTSNEIAIDTINPLDDRYKHICLNANVDRLAELFEGKKLFINPYNITKVEVLDKDTSTEHKEKEVTFVDVLGISSTVCRAIVVKLKIHHDDICHSVTNVDMEVDSIYKVVWYNEKEKSLFELIGRLIKIDEIDSNHNRYCENGYVRQEAVDGNGNPYYTNDFFKLPKYNPDGERIRFTFDTSKAFESIYDTVMLKDIRDVKLLLLDDSTPQFGCVKVDSY